MPLNFRVKGGEDFRYSMFQGWTWTDPRSWSPICSPDLPKSYKVLFPKRIFHDFKNWELRNAKVLPKRHCNRQSKNSWNWVGAIWGCDSCFRRYLSSGNWEWRTGELRIDVRNSRSILGSYDRAERRCNLITKQTVTSINKPKQTGSTAIWGTKNKHKVDSYLQNV